MTASASPAANRVSLLWAGVDRAHDIARLHAQVFDPAWTEASLRTMLDHPAATSFVATIGGPTEVVGFIIGQLAADEAEILTVGVAPSSQRAGIGRKLVEGLMRAANRAEARRIFLDVAADNEAAIALYDVLGFEQIGRRKGYYARASGPPVDAITMARALPI